MLKRKIDFSKALVCVCYGRMSGDRQNPRSPDQQFDEIRRTIERQDRPWQILRCYRDDAMSGRYVAKRPGLQQMLRDIRSAMVKVDAILVDTWERIGRTDELGNLRQELQSRYGVVILTANTGFTDPTTDMGRIVSMFEQFRATGVNEVKAHEVFRGKRGLALRKHWPGGPAPFGKKLVKKVVVENGREKVYSDLEDDPETIWIVVRLLALARQKGWGSTRLAKAMNEDADIPAQHKPCRHDTADYWLGNPIYVGDLRWADHFTGIVNDKRLLQKNEPDDVVYVKNFCAGVFPRADWEWLQALRKQRSERFKAARAGKASADNKQIQPVTPGLTLKYLLSGLVHCAHCHSRMVANSSRGASPNGRMLSYYHCPLSIVGGCHNSHYLREDKLRKAVIARLREHLFPPPANAQEKTPPWMEELMTLVRQALQAQAQQQADPRPAFRPQIQELSESMSGWMQSLSREDLPAKLRAGLETQ